MIETDSRVLPTPMVPFSLDFQALKIKMNTDAVLLRLVRSFQTDP